MLNFTPYQLVMHSSNVYVGVFGQISIDARHNHPVHAAATLRWRAPDMETKAVFFQYFDSGMTPAETMAHHDLLFEDLQMDRADASKNPKQSSVFGWHREWRAQNLG